MKTRGPAPWDLTALLNAADSKASTVERHLWIVRLMEWLRHASLDATGHAEEVRGLAVVGHQPLLKPGESFEYTSWVRLATPQGTMRGTFFCITEDAQWFEAPVPEFGLALASSLH